MQTQSVMFHSVRIEGTPCRALFPTMRRGLSRRGGFTILEALVSLVILMIFAVSSTVTLNLFNDRAARNRNMEAARGVVDDYVNYLLSDNVTLSSPTVDNGDVDDSGAPLGAVCTVIGARYIPDGTTAATATGIVPLIVARNTAASPVVSSKLYWRVQAAGTAYSLSHNTDLMQVQFTLVYTYRSNTYYYRTLTFKANNT